MNKFILLFFTIILFSGCATLKNELVHMKSSMVALDRNVILYSSDGKVIKTWRTRAKIEDNGGTVYFLHKGKAVTISGTFLIEEVVNE